jgi:hypothetical protein
LATAAATARVGDTEDDVREDLHASEMIDMGLHLEAQQRDLASDAGAVKTHATDRQKTALLERSNKLGRKLAEWMKIRESFTPAKRCSGKRHQRWTLCSMLVFVTAVDLTDLFSELRYFITFRGQGY